MNEYSPEKIEELWTKIAKKQLEGKKIIKVRYISLEEMKEFGWDNRSVVMELDDGNLITPSRDDEGNGAGALFTTDKQDSVLPVIP